MLLFTKPSTLLGLISLVALGVFIDCHRNVVRERVKAGHLIKTCPVDFSSYKQPQKVGSSIIPIKYWWRLVSSCRCFVFFLDKGANDKFLGLSHTYGGVPDLETAGTGLLKTSWDISMSRNPHKTYVILLGQSFQSCLVLLTSLTWPLSANSSALTGMMAARDLSDQMLIVSRLLLAHNTGSQIPQPRIQ